MKILRINYENVGLFENGLTIDFTANDRVVDTNPVTEIYKSIYTQNVLGFIGINATGKTTVLRLINIAMDVVLGNKGLNDIEIPLGIIKEGTIINTFFYLKDKLYKLSSEIGFKDEADNKLFDNQNCYFKEEIIKLKSIKSVKSKKMIFEFDNSEEYMRRSEVVKKEKFLKDYDSIISAITLEDKTIHADMMFATNFNFLWREGEAKKEFLNLFDKSIESINKESKKTSIKFKNEEKIVETERLFDIVKVLSSGTIKGINFLENTYSVLKNGGYLIIDEIENNMHKKLVQTIIRFFTDPDMNKHGATLIFSTHYVEIIDTIERKDNIYILRKDKDSSAECIKYSNEIKRNDIKKSEVFLANIIDGTAPNYEDIKIVRDFLCK